MREQGLMLGVDLGGTKGLFGLFEPDSALPLLQVRHACADFDGFEPMLACFLDEAAAQLGARGAQPAAACIGLAGPVSGGRARMTNLPWTLDARALRKRFAMGPTRLVNDFVAAAAGIDGLGPDGLRSLQAGSPVTGAARVILGPGTGLGAATLFPVGRRWRIAGGEGGHLGFAPRSELEVALWRWLRQLHGGRVSAERVLCGPGLVSLYRFLAGQDGEAGPDALLSAEDPAAAIAGAALAASPRATRALDLFAGMLGAFAGDLALFAMPRAGLYLAGGIPARIMDERRTALFLEGFRDKGRHAGLMDSVPVRLVIEPALGLIGAVALAAGRSSVLGETSARPASGRRVRT